MAGTDYDAVIVGAGFGGLYMLHELRRRGLDRRRSSRRPTMSAAPGTGTAIPARAATSRAWNTRYSFDEELEQEWRWTERYAAQPEILDYARHVADRFDLRRDISFSTRVTSATFDEASSTWAVETDRRRDGARALLRDGDRLPLDRQPPGHPRPR